MNHLAKFMVREASITGEIRRTIVSWGRDLNFDETTTGKIAIVINELSTNILKHAGSGEIICCLTDCSIEILAMDKGPGMADPNQCFKDGYSTQGTQGTGLGAIKRLSSRFDMFTQVGKGTVIYSQFTDSNLERKESAIDFGGLSVPYKDEAVCGDGWMVKVNGLKAKILVSDGLGHGLYASQATQLGLQSFEASPHHSALEDVNALHLALKSSRGAAVGVAHADFENLKVDYAGLGNIASTIFSAQNVRRMISYNGITGVQMRKVQPMTYPMDKYSIIILASDGLSTHWNLSDYPGLQFRAPYLVAGVLYRDFGKSTDDVTVLVVRQSE